MRLTVEAIQELAIAWTPEPARWRSLLTGCGTYSFGPAHEIAHALIASPRERQRLRYGLPHGLADRPHGCTCPAMRCVVYERAAMRISRALLTAAGAPDLAAEEEDETSRFEELDRPDVMRRSWRLIRKLHLWPLPRTRAGLERLLRRRLGR